MATTRYFVPTDADGTQHQGDDVTHWPLPVRGDGGGVEPGEVIEPTAGTPLVVHDLDGLLEDLGERIFLAELVGGGPAEAARGARLVAETEWTLHRAARFAVDCAEHAVFDAAKLRLPSGASLADVLVAARRYLDQDEQADTSLLQRLSRFALARRLRRLGDQVGAVAFELAREDEAADLDALDDPAWTAVASVRDAVLAVVEAIRHDAAPELVESSNRRYESDGEPEGPEPEVVQTPWGTVLAGQRSGVVPAWTAARDAAERARLAVADESGAQAAAAEREWQRGRLAEALGLD